MDKLTIDLSLESPTMTFSEVGIPGPRGFKGEKGETGAPLRFTDLTPAQKLEIQGERGLQGIQGIKGDSIKGDKGDRGLQGIQGERFTYADFTPENKMELSQVAVDAVVPFVSQVTSLKNDVVLAKATAVKSSEEAMDYNKNAQVAAQSATKDASEAISASSKVSTAYSDIKAIQVDVVAKASGVSQNALQVSTQASQVAVSATTVSSQAADVAIKAKAADASSKAAVDASAKAILAKESIDQKAVIIEGQYSGVVEKHNDVVSKHADVVAAQSQVASNTSNVTAMVSQASASAASASKSASSAANKATETESARVVTMAARDEAVAAAAQLTGALNYEGIYDASSGVYPTSKGRDSFWKVVVPGTIGTVQFKLGDQIEYRVSTNGYTRVPNSAPVLSVNGKDGAVTITAADVGALPSAWTPTWGDVKGKPTAFPPEAHKHAWGDLVGIPLVFASNWASVADKPTAFPPVVHQHSWKDLADKPSTFAPEAHSHTWDALGGKPSVFASEWAQVSNKPAVYPPAVHTHSWDTVTGKPSVFPTEWSAVSNQPIFATRWPKWSEVPEKPSVFPPEGHRHAWGDLTGVPSVFATNWASIANIPLNASRWPTLAEVTDKPTNYPTNWGNVADKPVYALRWPTIEEVGAVPVKGARLDSLGEAGTYVDAPLDFKSLTVGQYGLYRASGSTAVPPSGTWGEGFTHVEVQSVYAGGDLVQVTLPFRDASTTAFRTKSSSNVWGDWVTYYTDHNKPKVGDITGAVGLNRKNQLDFGYGVGLVTKTDSGPSWIGLYSGTETGPNVVLGTLQGGAVLGAHNAELTAWAPLFVNCVPDAQSQPTILGNPSAQVGAAIYPIYHRGNPPSPADIGALPANGKAMNSATLEGRYHSENADAVTVVSRDISGDITARLFRSSYPSQSYIEPGASLCWRVNNEGDPFMRFASLDAVRNWLGRVNDSATLGGKTVDQVKSEARAGLAVDSITINNKRINANITLGAADMGLGNVANFGHTSGWDGQSTTLYATQKAVCDAAAAPALETARKRYIAYSHEGPYGDAEEGAIWIQW